MKLPAFLGRWRRRRAGARCRASRARWRGKRAGPDFAALADLECVTARTDKIGEAHSDAEDACDKVRPEIAARSSPARPARPPCMRMGGGSSAKLELPFFMSRRLM